MKGLFSLLTSLGICAITALPAYSLSPTDSVNEIEDYYTTRNLITPSLTKTQIQAFKQQIRKEACVFGETRTLLENDVTLRYRFWTPDGQLLKTWLLASSAVNCNSTESLPIQVINPVQDKPKTNLTNQPNQPITPINNLSLAVITLVVGILFRAIAKSLQSTPKTQEKPLTAKLNINHRSNTICPFSSRSKKPEKVEIINFCVSKH